MTVLRVARVGAVALLLAAAAYLPTAANDAAPRVAAGVDHRNGAPAHDRSKGAATSTETSTESSDPSGASSPAATAGGAGSGGDQGAPPAVNRTPVMSMQVGPIGFDGSPGTNPPLATLAGCPMVPFALDGRAVPSSVSTVPSPILGNLGFSPPLDHLRAAGAFWASWSHGYTGDVYASDPLTSVTLTMPPHTSAFAFYAEPNQFAIFNITASTPSGTTSGAVSVDGRGGARYFGFYGIGKATVDSITVSSTVDFAVGEFTICQRFLTELSDFHTWASLRNSSRNGAFDVMTELLQNGQPVVSGLARCVRDVSRDGASPTEVVVHWAPFSPIPVDVGDMLALRVAIRAGTNPDGSMCDGSSGGQFGAVGVRLAYGAASRPSRFAMTVTPFGSKVEYLQSAALPCSPAEAKAEVAGSLEPGANGNEKCTDSGPVNYNAGNEWAVLGVWSAAPQP